MYSNRNLLSWTLLVIVLTSCVIEDANPTAIKSKHRQHGRVKRAAHEFDDDVEMISDIAQSGQKSSSLKTTKTATKTSSSKTAPSKVQEFDDEDEEVEEFTQTTKTKGRPVKQVEEIEYEEEVEEEEEDGGIKSQKTTRKTGGGGGGTKTQYTEQEFVEEIVAGSDQEETIRQMFGHGLVCLDVHDEKTKTTPSFQALVKELTKKYGKKPHIHTTSPDGGGSSDHQQDEYEYYVYDDVNEMDPVTKLIKKVKRRRVATHEEYTEYIRRSKKVLRKTKKIPKCVEPGLMGDENDCTKFYECSHKAGGGYNAIRKDCPPGTIFDESISTCNHIWAVDPKPVCWDAEDDDDGTKGFRGSDDEDDDGDSTTKKPWHPAFPGQQNPEPDEIFDHPPCKKPGYFELPNHCDRYYHCLASKGHVEFKEYLTCDDNEVFVESASDCVPVGQLPANHRCRAQSQIKGPDTNTNLDSDEEPDSVIPDKSAPPKRPTTTKPPVKLDPKPTFACEKHGKFPHPTKCDTYYTCLVVNKQLRSTRHKCTAGTYFDIEHEMCSPQESITSRPECADHDTSVQWPKTGDQDSDGQTPGQTPDADDLQQREDDDQVDFDENEIETYKDENGITRRRLKKARKVVYEYEDESFDENGNKVTRKIRRTIRTRKITRGEQLEELEKILKKKVKKVLKRTVLPPEEDADDGQQVAKPEPLDSSDEEPDRVTPDKSPPKKGGGQQTTDLDDDDVPPPDAVKGQHNCDDQLAEVEKLRKERDDAVKKEQDKDKLVKQLRQEKETKDQIIQEKESLITDLKLYKKNTEELVETLKVERDEAQELVESVRTELDRVKEVLNQLKIQKETDDAELIRLRKELASCNSRYNNLRKVMDGNDLALKSCKHEASTLQQCCDDDQQNSLVKSRKRRAADNAASNSSFRNKLINDSFSTKNETNYSQESNEPLTPPELREPTNNKLIDGTGSKNEQNSTTVNSNNYVSTSSGTSPSVFEQQIQILIFIFLTLLLVAVLIMGCSVIRKLNQMTAFPVSSSNDLETTAYDDVKSHKGADKLKSSTDKQSKLIFTSVPQGESNNKTKKNSYFAYVDE